MPVPLMPMDTMDTLRSPGKQSNGNRKSSWATWLRLGPCPGYFLCQTSLCTSLSGRSPSSAFKTRIVQTILLMVWVWSCPQYSTVCNFTGNTAEYDNIMIKQWDGGGTLTSWKTQSPSQLEAVAKLPHHLSFANVHWWWGLCCWAWKIHKYLVIWL